MICVHSLFALFTLFTLFDKVHVCDEEKIACMLAASLSHASVIQMGHSCLLSIAEPPFFDLKIEASCGFCRKVPTPPIDVIARGQKASCLDSLSVQSSWFLLSRYWYKLLISFFSAGLVATIKVLIFEPLKLGFQCELPSQEWESVASASLQIQCDFFLFQQKYKWKTHNC